MDTENVENMQVRINRILTKKNELLEQKVKSLEFNEKYLEDLVFRLLDKIPKI